MTQRGRLGGVVESAWLNAVLSWVLIGFVLLVIPVSVITGYPLWAGFAAVVAGLSLIPFLAYRRPRAMLPWEVLALAALPLIGRTFATVPVTGRFATYLSVTALALIIAVELHTFTAVRMTSGFAVLFVVIATMATAGVWAIVRWSVDITLGTGFLLVPGVDEAVIENRLMWEFVYSTAAGVAGGLIFEGYFRRRAGIEARVPGDLEA